MIGVAIKYIAELLSWFYSKLQNYFNGQQAQKDKNVELIDTLETVGENIKSIDAKLDNLNEVVRKLEKESALTTERLQEQARSYIIDKHHHFCYEIGAIDDINLQSIERQFLYYKNAGGDTYIDNLVAEIRELPKLSLNTSQGLEKFKTISGFDFQTKKRKEEDWGEQ
jgi:predicted nuclease with TOPRIM domain